MIGIEHAITLLLEQGNRPHPGDMEIHGPEDPGVRRQLLQAIRQKTLEAIRFEGEDLWWDVREMGASEEEGYFIGADTWMGEYHFETFFEGDWDRIVEIRLIGGVEQNVEACVRLLEQQDEFTDIFIDAYSFPTDAGIDLVTAWDYITEDKIRVYVNLNVSKPGVTDAGGEENWLSLFGERCNKVLMRQLQRHYGRLNISIGEVIGSGVASFTSSGTVQYEFDVFLVGDRRKNGRSR